MEGLLPDSTAQLGVDKDLYFLSCTKPGNAAAVS